MRALGLLALCAACGGRNEIYDASGGTGAGTFGLESGVVLLDAPADRALAFRVRGTEVLHRSLPVGRNVVASAVSTDRRRVAFLAVGEAFRDEADDPGPQLAVVSAAAGEEASVRTFPLAAPHSGLALDPLGEFAVVHAAPNSQGATQLAENPNELVLVDLRSGGIVTRSLRSFGGKPQRFTFTQPLGLPGETRRLLVVETEQDLTLLDLAHLDRPEITVRLTSGQDARVVTPAGVVVDDGDPSRDDDTRVAVRTQSGADVFALTLAPSPGTPNGFTPLVNLAGAGGTVSDLAFVQTDAGLRIAALVPSAQKAVLIEPDTSRTTDVALGTSLSRISVAGSADVALLYGASSASSVAFWSFRGAPERPYRTVEILPLPASVGEVREVPEQPNVRLAIGAGSLFVLDLVQRTASPLSTLQGASVHVAPDGGRFWVYGAGGTDLAKIDVNGLGLSAVPLQRTVRTVFDVANEGGGRALVAVDDLGAGALTVLDALAPDPSKQTHLGALFLMDAP